MLRCFAVLALRVLAVAVSVLAARAPAQKTPIPSEYHAIFGHHGSAGRWALEVDGIGLDCWIEYSNFEGDNSVSIMWGVSSSTTRVERVDFQPTGVCPDTNDPRVLYVCGWLPWTAELLVEKWVVEDGEYANRSELTHAMVNEPILRMTGVTQFRATEPCRAIAHVGTTDVLWALGRNPDDVIYEINASGQTRVKFIDVGGSAVDPDGPTPSEAPPIELRRLSRANHMRSGEHTQLGFAVMLDPLAIWQGNGLYGLKSDDKVLLMIDYDRDGAVDEIASHSFGGGLQRTYGKFGEWED